MFSDLPCMWVCCKCSIARPQSRNTSALAFVTMYRLYRYVTTTDGAWLRFVWRLFVNFHLGSMLSQKQWSSKCLRHERLHMFGEKVESGQGKWCEVLHRSPNCSQPILGSEVTLQPARQSLHFFQKKSTTTSPPLASLWDPRIEVGNSRIQEPAMKANKKVLLSICYQNSASKCHAFALRILRQGAKGAKSRAPEDSQIENPPSLKSSRYWHMAWQCICEHPGLPLSSWQM